MTGTSPLTMIPVGSDRALWEFVRTLRNDPRLKVGFIKQDDITREQQERYMSRWGDSYFVCCVDGDPAGYCGVVDNDIRIATHPDRQRLGVAAFMLDFLRKRFPEAVAKIKVENEGSLRLFVKAGYVPRYYILEPS